MKRPRVLFLCTGNSCRSQMAEGWLRHLAGEHVEALSAGTRPKGIHPLAMHVMAEVGIDLGQQSSKSIDAFVAEPPDVVIAVCEHAAASCPTLPGASVLRWPFPDPDAATGDASEILRVFRASRDSIRARIEAWLVERGYSERRSLGPSSGSSAAE